MDNETKRMMITLVDIMLSSCTDVHSDGVVEHEHMLFDNDDRNRLESLRLELSK